MGRRFTIVTSSSPSELKKDVDAECNRLADSNFVVKDFQFIDRQTCAIIYEPATPRSG